MKDKIIRYTKILISNIILFFIFLFMCDFIIYQYQTKDFTKEQKTQNPFLVNIFNPTISLSRYNFDLDNEYGESSWNGRKPDGLEYSNNTPILVLGCSFAFGQHLYKDQTFSYKLAHLLKRPVYNRALAGAGVQHMYYQTTNEDFYNDVPKTDTVIHIIINDHYRRMFGEMFKVTDPVLNLHYKKKNNTLVMDNYNNFLLNFFKFSNTFEIIRHKYQKFYIRNPKNAENLTDEMVLYFIKIRENLENRWNTKLNYTVVLYRKILHADILEKKLKQNGFNVIKTSDITTEDLNTMKYKMEDDHPKESAWTLLTPIIIKTINL